MQIRLSDHFSFGRLLRFTLPSIAMMILTSLYSVADGLFVSNMVGDIGLSAVNIMFPVAMLIAAVGFMLGTGGSAVVARTLGEGRPDMANRFFSMFVFAVILFGGILSAAGAAFVEPIARLAGASDILMDSCVSYGRILFAGSLPFMLQTSLQPFFVVAEKPNMGLILSIASGVTNFAGDWVLIQLIGLPGAAWATVAGYCVGVLHRAVQRRAERLHLLPAFAAAARRSGPPASARARSGRRMARRCRGRGSFRRRLGGAPVAAAHAVSLSLRQHRTMKPDCRKAAQLKLTFPTDIDILVTL